MPPRRAAKKKTPAKKAAPKPEVEETPSSVIEEETAITNVSEGEKNQENVFTKEDVSVTTTTTTTVVVEESKVTEEITEEQKSGIEGSNVGEDAMVVVEESKVSEEKELKVSGSSSVDDVTMVEEASLSVVVEESEVTEETVEGAEDVMDGNAEDEEEEDGESDESDPEEDDIQDVVEGEEMAGEVTIGGEDANDNTGDNEGGDSEGEESESDSDDEDDEDVDLSSYMQMAPLKDKKKQSGVEIFVGGLNRKAVEEDLTEVFGEFGELKAVRIVKHPVTQRSKGYAFISYATVEQAKKVLTDLKDGIEVKGKRAGVSPSQDSDTLYVGNICKSWTKEQVLETLKGFGIEHFEEIYLPEDPKSEGKIRGFAYLEFLTHSDAMTAFQRLRKPDAVFGRNRSAKVAFAPSMHPSEEALSQVKTVYVEGLTDSWGEEKLKKLCEQYGQVEKVQLSRDLVTVKRKDFGFVSFNSRENALDCVAGINNAQIGEGEFKVKANIAKPQYKGRLGKNARGGYKVQKDGEKVETGKSKAEGGAKAKGNKRREKAPPRLKSQGATDASKDKEEPAKGRKRDGRNMNSRPSERPSKKPRGNARGRPMNGSGNRGKSFHSGRGRQPHRYDRAPAAYVDPYVRGYAASGPSYSGHAYSSVSDMEPHAGYLKPPTTNQGRDPYDYRLRRASGYDSQGSGATSYVGGSMLPPSYAPGYSRYAAYESGSAGRYAYPSSRGYLHGRPYY